jgi:hypothetical protein
MSNHNVIKKTCNTISSGDIDSAKSIIESEYPFLPLTNKGRQYTDSQKTKVFIKDGFIDNCSGNKLVFPPVLRL